LLAPPISQGFLVCILIAIAFYEKDPRKASKKKLVMTGRATRIYAVAAAVLLALAALYTLPGVPTLAWILPIQFPPLALVIANLVLAPYEQRVQQGFWNEAHEKLGKVKPVVIGITGSYGKTSTKHILGHILELQAPTLITPGSVNTPMGVSRIIRERLGAHHRFFVCEMGAYGPGSIARLCRLAPPDVAVLTAIGMAHYERFKSLETVAKAKLELAEAAASRQGPVIFHEQVLELEDTRAFRARHLARTAVVGSSVDSTFRLRDPEQTSRGIRVTVTWQEQDYVLEAPLYGTHHIGNMAVAFATACTLGIPAADAATALASVPQIAHRLEVKTGTNGSRLIDDAYNSNPVGFVSALHLLDLLRGEGGRRILVTPGMVELGTAHDSEHERIGLVAGQHADVLLAVLPVRISSFVSAFKVANPDGLVISCGGFSEAQTWLDGNVGPSDVVLLENDLPDLYERKVSL
jgi:UDP-N-acetylmuramoyl-tripeptide--D-alanyl-D-alanine ligase